MMILPIWIFWIRCKNLNLILIGHLIINSLRNKLEILVYLIALNMDILLISRTKLYDSFPVLQFLIRGFENAIPLDQSSSSDGIMLDIREGIRFKLLKSSGLLANTEVFLSEEKINKKNGFLVVVAILTKR